MADNKEDYQPLWVPENYKEWKAASASNTPEKTESADTGRLYDFILQHLQSAERYRTKLGEMAAHTDKKVTVLEERLHGIDSRVSTLDSKVDQRSTKIEGAIDQLPSELRSTIWKAAGLYIGILGIIVSVLLVKLPSPHHPSEQSAPIDLKNSIAQQGGTDQPVTAPKSQPEGKEKPKLESEVHPQ